MEKINAWCKIIALISILSSVFLLILPESKSKKAFKMLLSFIMIFAFVYPLSDFEIDFSSVMYYLDGGSEDDLKSEYEQYEYYPLIYASQTETEEYIEDLLFSLNLTGECEVICAYENDKIIISEVTVRGIYTREEKVKLEMEIYKICNNETKISFVGE